MNPDNNTYYRLAVAADIPGMQVVRRAVKENALSHPDRIQDADYVPYLEERGRGWVAVEGERIVGFAIADLQEGSVWALFVHPEAEGRGIGKELHRLMMDWYFAQGKAEVWLSTAVNTRADEFYRRQGWQDGGMYNEIERKWTKKRG